jgi:hypothetical protein
MNHVVYNVSVGAGLICTGSGIGLQFGVGYGLAAFGLLLIGLTTFGARLAARREG